MRLSQYLAYERARCHQCLTNFLVNLPPNLWFVNKWLRPQLARLMGMKCGASTLLEKTIFFGNIRNVRIGTRSIVCRGTFMDGYDTITLGNRVDVGFQVTFITGSHQIGEGERRAAGVIGHPICVGDGVWIGARAIIGPGTVIGEGSVISAGSSLMHSVPPHSLVAGVPGRVIKRFDASDNTPLTTRKPDELCP